MNIYWTPALIPARGLGSITETVSDPARMPDRNTRVTLHHLLVTSRGRLMMMSMTMLDRRWKVPACTSPYVKNLKNVLANQNSRLKGVGQ